MRHPNDAVNILLVINFIGRFNLELEINLKT
jgi:hypothetical protein